MADEGFKRKLAAILSADVEGYSRLMDDDEEATVRTLTAYRNAINDLVQQYRGRIVDSPGDNILAEFTSVVDAVNCAVEIQQELAKRNTALPDERKMQFRIGVNLGDVIDEEERIYGDGVNIAARIESLSESGGICISHSAYDQIKNKLKLGYEYLGEHEVKNIREPLKAYRVLMAPEFEGQLIGVKKKTSKSRWTGVVAASVVLIIGIVLWQFYQNKPIPSDKKPSAEKPSIAILPFENMSDDPEQEYFSDGITDDLITDLSKISGLFVIARNSTFQYKGKPVDIKKVSRDLGIRYVLEGSVRRAGDKMRINAQLIDSTTGGHLWAERYDGQMEDIFSLQDQITQKIVAALAVKLTPGEKENIASKGTDNIEAYDAFLKGWQHYLRYTPEDCAIAIEYLKKALELDPDYGQAYAALAHIYYSQAGAGREWEKALQANYFTAKVKARYFLNMAMKNPTSLAYRLASKMDLKRRRYKEAIQYAEKATLINPNDADSQFAMARILVFSGSPKEGMDVAKKVMQLDPNRMADCLQLSGIANFYLGEYEAAIASFERALKYNPSIWVRDWIASAYSNLNREKEANAAFEKYKKRWLEAVESELSGIKFDLQLQVYNNPFMDIKIIERYIDGLIKAGAPEPHRYYEADKKNKITGDEIKDLVFGRTETGLLSGATWTIKFKKNGNAVWDGYGFKDEGKWWVEGDQLCQSWNNFFGEGLTYYSDIYRNPEGTLEEINQYIRITDFNMYGASYID
jgi:TolB-like protein/class 3 adenylate cyclase/Flp pilus assembly protein TadD